LFEPFWRQETGSMTAPAVDVAETEKAYEIAAEMPGLDGKNVEVKFADGILNIKGEKQEEKEEKKKSRLHARTGRGSDGQAYSNNLGVHSSAEHFWRSTARSPPGEAASQAQGKFPGTSDVFHYLGRK
jgi:Hsp20/alpha crystallin family